MKRRLFHQIVFVAAGFYNLLWGLASSIWPQWFFDFTGLPRINHPAIFACLGMVIGIYGLLYLEVARRPENGWPVAAVGLLGKLLGPIGLGVLILRKEWPPATIILCLTNDFIWYPFFFLYVRDAWPPFRSTWKAR